MLSLEGDLVQLDTLKDIKFLMTFSLNDHLPLLIDILWETDIFVYAVVISALIF